MRCPRCGCEMGEVMPCDTIRDPMLRAMLEGIRGNVVCDECARKAAEMDRQEQRRRAPSYPPGGPSALGER